MSQRGLVKPVLNDLNLIIGANQALIVAAAFLAFVILPALEIWREHKIEADHALILNDPALRVIQGEKPSSFEGKYTVMMGDQYFRKRFLSFYAKKPKESIFFAQYRFDVEPGIYKIFAASSPAGATQEKGPMTSYSPYEVSIDGGYPIVIDSEVVRGHLLQSTGNDFYQRYTYAPAVGFTKIGEFELAEGRHEITFRVKKGRRFDNRLFFYLDAIFVVPKDWNPGRKLHTFPNDLFSA